MNVFVGYPRELMGILSTMESKRKVFVDVSYLFLRNCFLAKYLSGRTMELDKVYEPEHDDQSSAASEIGSGRGYDNHDSHDYKVF